MKRVNLASDTTTAHAACYRMPGGNPADIPKSQKDTLQKTDPRDARNIGFHLQSNQLHGIHIPDEQQEADRYFSVTAKGYGKTLRVAKTALKVCWPSVA